MTEDLDAVVVGAGLTGSATALALARRGRSVLLLEQFAADHSSGSSHGSARIVRRAYSDALYTRLTGRAFELWREIEDRSGQTLLRMLGGLDYGADRDVVAVAAHLAGEGVPHEVLPAAEAERRWPGMRFRGDVVYHPEAGTMDAAGSVAAMTALAMAGGAQLRTETAAARIDARDDGAEVVLSSGETVRARCVVVAAGGWVEPLLAGSNLTAPIALPPLAVTQQQVFHFPRLDLAAPPWPSVIHEEGVSIYHLAGGRDGGAGDDRKIGEHHFGTPTTAAGRTGVVDASSRERVVEYVRRWLPGLDPSPRGETTCLYTTTPTEHFVLDRIGPVVVSSPCSGHGAKFAPLIGELTADLVDDAAAETVPHRFRLAAHAAAGATGRGVSL